MIILLSLYIFRFASSPLKRLILALREVFFFLSLFIPSAVGTGFYPSVLLTCLFDLQAQKITFQQQGYVSEGHQYSL